MPPDTGMARAKKERAKSEASWWRPPVPDRRLTRQTPPRTSRIPTPLGGWMGQRAFPKEWNWGLLQPCSRPPPPPGVEEGGLPAGPRWNRGYATSSVILSCHPLYLGLTYVNPPGPPSLMLLEMVPPSSVNRALIVSVTSLSLIRTLSMVQN
jgi:hypothetical protein